MEFCLMRSIIIVGGTGRIGSTVAAHLLSLHPDVQVTVTGRDRSRGLRLVSELGERARFKAVDREDARALRSLIDGAALVIHAAGPFQGSDPTVLESAIDCRVRYLDIADELLFAQKARALSSRAAERGVCALVNGGVFPGLSNVMAGLLAETALVESMSFSYFIAGSGGSGPAVMASTFILGTVPATEFVAGQRVERRAFTGGQALSFLPPVGRRTCYFLELPEVTSCFETYRIPNVVARFGTSPGLWNHATRWVCTLFRPWLADRRRVASFVAPLLPLIRIVDRFVGAAIAIEVEAEFRDGQRRRLRYAHQDTLASIGAAVVAQAEELLQDRVAPGVLWPEEGIRDKKLHLLSATQGGTFEFVRNRNKSHIE